MHRIDHLFIYLPDSFCFLKLSLHAFCLLFYLGMLCLFVLYFDFFLFILFLKIEKLAIYCIYLNSIFPSLLSFDLFMILFTIQKVFTNKNSLYTKHLQWLAQQTT